MMKPPFSDLQTRREFLSFMGRHSAALALLSTSSISCISPSKDEEPPFVSIEPTTEDRLTLAPGLEYYVLLKWGDTINKKGEKFGYNNDYVAFIPFHPGDQKDGMLWINHESPEPLFVSDYEEGTTKTRAQVLKEQHAVGGSIVRIQQVGVNQSWKVRTDDPLNRRFTAQTPIPFSEDTVIQGGKLAIGTFANCAGGVTPWRTILTCEENYQDYYGEVDYSSGQRVYSSEPCDLGWETYYSRPPEHYGWVVEVHPFTGKAKKLVSLGRFCHESATTIQAKDGRCVVYSGDDDEDQCLYKFVSDEVGSLDKGTLYVANLEKKQWIPLDIKKSTILAQNFKTQLDIQINTRRAAHLVGGTPLDRPEDIEIDPKTKDVFVALTNNKDKGNYYGSILKISEKNQDPLSLEFESATFVSGGKASGFACPDNLAFDKKGNLWFTTDISSKSIDEGPYKGFGNNGLFYVPLSGSNAGQAFQIAAAPKDAELTGPCFSPDGRTLFLSVQHPGDQSKKGQLTSHWPTGGESEPAPAVVAISGSVLDKLTS